LGRVRTTTSSTTTSFEWVPEKHRENYKRYAEPWGNGMINWNGLLLDGWRPI